MSDNYTNDFIQGQKDCRDGVDHAAGKSAGYNEGCRTQYALDQQQSERTIKHGH